VGLYLELDAHRELELTCFSARRLTGNEHRALVYVSFVLDALRPSTGADGDTRLRSVGCVLKSREAESES